MPREELPDIYVRCLERYAELFDSTEAECQALRWWIWASRHLPRVVYEEVRKKRWERATKMEQRVAKAGVPNR